MTTTTISCTNESCRFTTDVEETSSTNPRHCPKCGAALVVTGTLLPFPNRGIIQHRGLSLALTQEAYLDGDGNSTYYRARAIGEDGSEHDVFWKPYPEFMEIEDASDHCDWDAYTVDCR